MAQINKIDKTINDNNIAKSNVGGMLFPANDTDHKLLMAYYLKWGLLLSDGTSLDTTEEVINYLLSKIDDLYNKISGIEDETEYDIVISTSSSASCDTSKISKSGGIITITPNSGEKIENVTATNCAITHIDNSNKYNITDVTGNITLTVNTIPVDIKINGDLYLSNLAIIREKNDVLNSITQIGGGIVNDKTYITIGGTALIEQPTSVILNYGNKEGSVNLSFSGNDLNSTPNITVDSSKLIASNLTNNGVTLESKGVITEQTQVTIKFTDANNLYEKIFNINVSITNDSSSTENIYSGWTYASKNTSVAIIREGSATIYGRGLGTSEIVVQYDGKEDSIVTINVIEAEVTDSYYWYVGQEVITGDNYTTLAESSSTKYTTKNYTTEKYGKVYILTPDIVTSIKIKDVNANVYVAESKYKIDSTINIDGYNVYVTSAFGANAPQIIEYYY